MLVPEAKERRGENNCQQHFNFLRSVRLNNGEAHLSLQSCRGVPPVKYVGS